MRIIAGKDRGRVISTPSGESTRPTIDRVRESMMSAVYSSIGDFEGVRVLDLFAGSGALGIESLSRGCDFVLFNDIDPDARRCIERNVGSLGYDDSQAKISSVNALSGGSIYATKPFDLVFLDPPYETAQEDIYSVIRSLADKGIVSPSALIVYEHDVPADESKLSEHTLKLSKEKKYGKTYVSYLIID